MIQFYNSFKDDPKILATLWQELTWSHIRLLFPIKDKNERNFYALMCIRSGWSVRQLEREIHRMLYARTLASQREGVGIYQNAISPANQDDTMHPSLILKDPYILEFLGLSRISEEKDLEDAILKEIERFILELGTGFSFIERQKRMTIGEEHFYLDLLFYNRKLRRMVAIELKNGKFKPAYKGQMELYLGWLKKYEVLEGENPPIGIILCTEKSSHQIELLDMDQSGIHVAEYWTELPPKDVFERKIREIVQTSKARYIALQNYKKEDN